MCHINFDFPLIEISFAVADINSLRDKNIFDHVL